MTPHELFYTETTIPSGADIDFSIQRVSLYRKRKPSDHEKDYAWENVVLFPPLSRTESEEREHQLWEPHSYTPSKESPMEVDHSAIQSLRDQKSS